MIAQAELYFHARAESIIIEAHLSNAGMQPAKKGEHNET
jgi:hypothetical protein